MTRFAIPDFMTANPMYIGARVSFYVVDEDTGDVDASDTLITLYDAPTGTGTLKNPQTLDSLGKFLIPVYAEVPTIAVISGLSAPDHQTGIIRATAGDGVSLRACTVYPSADIVSPTYPYAIVFNTELRDTDAIHESVTHPTRLTVPTGATNVVLRGHVSWTATIAADAGVHATIYKNGSAVYFGRGEATGGKAFYGNPALDVQTAILIVVPGDYFELVADTSDATSTIEGARTWFEMEIKD